MKSGYIGRMTNMTEIESYLDDLTEEFQSLQFIDELEMMRRLVELGRELPLIASENQTDENFVQGCVSQVYVYGELKDELLNFTASSESKVVAGFVKVLIECYNGLNPAAIPAELEGRIFQFVTDCNLQKNLTPTRSNAFVNVLKQMQRQAAALA